MYTHVVTELTDTNRGDDNIYANTKPAEPEQRFYMQEVMCEYVRAHVKDSYVTIRGCQR